MAVFLVQVNFQVVDRQAAEMNAQLLDQSTPPLVSGGFSLDVEADDAPQALADAFTCAAQFQAGLDPDADA